MRDVQFDLKVLELAGLQAWMLTRAQAKGLGATPDMIRGRVGSGLWVRIGDGLYRLAAMPLHPDEPLWKAVLIVGADVVFSHESAAFEHGLVGARPGVVEAIVRHGSHPKPPGVRIHGIDDLWLDPAWIVERRGLSFTSEARTAVDLGMIWGYPRLFKAVDDAKVRGVLTLDEVGGVLAAVARRGKRGLDTVARVLDDIYGKPPKMSDMEGKFYDILMRPGMPEWVPQMEFPGRVQTARCVDAGIPDAKLILEADGRAWHTRIAEMKRDSDRDIEVARNGGLTSRFLGEHILSDPDGTAASILAIYEVRKAQLAA